MSANILCTLTCDNCGVTHDDGVSQTARSARKTAKAEGWIAKHGDGTMQDLCFSCHADPEAPDDYDEDLL